MTRLLSEERRERGKEKAKKRDYSGKSGKKKWKIAGLYIIVIWKRS